MIAAETDESAGSHAEEDENYFVSMTDMMVGILFIFIIMLMVFALNFQKQTDQTETLTKQQREQIEKAQELARQIAVLQVRIDAAVSEIRRTDNARNELLEEIQDRLEAAGLKVTIDQNTGVLRLDEDAVRFKSDSSALDAIAATNVDKVSQVLLDVLPAYTACRRERGCTLPSSGYRLETVFIEGHTDKNGGPELNWPLSTARAVNTYRRMVDVSSDLRTLMNSHKREVLSVSGYADTRPATDRDDDNRRIDLRFVMEADREERLSEVANLLNQMKGQVEALQDSARAGLPDPEKPTPNGAP
ncbi:OmpA family protein [Aminobacter aminovorans]|uniref:Flagellar motor protein MotB n=1 Tax=Aminobacter aminovorans TaxID=83263 RepID=A0AAC9FD61_AMIAI|nr:OmpA family protein [Aminobacter aminovorans]AMS40142.1 OmpA/MotB domain protein [Aminobacter aminovorans]MBB3709869.1 flagellar motor protein MotB [Aminobacter aminovorans]